MAWGDYIEAKQTQQQGIQSTNITPVDILGAIAIIVVCVLAIIGVALAIKKIRKQAAAHSNSDKRYKRLETFALWRFSKVLFWVVIIIAALFLMLYQDTYGHYTLARLGIILLIFSYPLYMLFRHTSLYIAYGKTWSKERKQ